MPEDNEPEPPEKGRSQFTANLPEFLNTALAIVYDGIEQAKVSPGMIRRLLESVNLFIGHLVQEDPRWTALDREFGELPWDRPVDWHKTNPKAMAHFEARLHLLQQIMREHGVCAVMMDESKEAPARKASSISKFFSED